MRNKVLISLGYPSWAAVWANQSLVLNSSVAARCLQDKARFPAGTCSPVSPLTLAYYILMPTNYMMFPQGAMLCHSLCFADGPALSRLPFTFISLEIKPTCPSRPWLDIVLQMASLTHPPNSSMLPLTILFLHPTNMSWALFCVRCYTRCWGSTASVPS